MSEYSDAFRLVGKPVRLVMFPEQVVWGTLTLVPHSHYEVNGVKFRPVLVTIFFEWPMPYGYLPEIQGRALDVFQAENI